MGTILPSGAPRDSTGFRTAPVPFPVGTEYYRAPMPPPEFWDRDFAAIRAAGMRIVRTFSYWNWMEPAPGSFELDDFDRFFELAARHDLLVWFDLTLATHGACPDWLLREHPDIRQVRPDGTPLHPDSTNAMPQGRMIHCYDHPKWREYGERLLRTVVGRYRDHESLLIWGVWDGASFPTTDGPVCPCYCASTLDRYAEWLKRRYTLDELNERLHRRYRCWEDVAPPRSSRNVVEMLLYRQFHVENLAEALRWQVQVIRELDARHELRAHGANMPRLFDEACAREVDSWGMSMPSNELLAGPDPLRIAERCFSFDWSRSIGRGGRWWNEEIYAGMSPAGVTWKPQSHPTEVTSLLWLSLIHGAAGAMFWQYTPEYLSFEAPGYSLTAPDRAPTGRLQAVRRALADIERIAGHLPLQVPRADVAILYDGPSAEIFLYNGEQQSYLDGLLGLYRTLWAHGIPADVITSGHDWSPYRVVWLPNTALLEAATVDRIAGAVAQESGPCVVADGNLGSYAESGRFSYAPPEGLSELLGVRVADYDRFTPGRAGDGLLSGGFGHSGRLGARRLRRPGAGRGQPGAGQAGRRRGRRGARGPPPGVARPCRRRPRSAGRRLLRWCCRCSPPAGCARRSRSQAITSWRCGAVRGPAATCCSCSIPPCGTPPRGSPRRGRSRGPRTCSPRRTGS